MSAVLVHHGVVLDGRTAGLVLTALTRAAKQDAMRNGGAPLVPPELAQALPLLRTAARGAAAQGGVAMLAVPAGSGTKASNASSRTASAHEDLDTAQTAAGRWGVSDSLVRRFCRDRRVPGARRLPDGSWRIPVDAPHPAPRAQR